MKLKGCSKGKFVGLSSFVMALAVLGTALLCPFDGQCADAASAQRLSIDFVVRQALDSKRLTIDFFLTQSGNIDYQSIAKQLGIDFYIQEKINLGISGVTNVDGTADAEHTTTDKKIIPTVGGTIVSGRTDFKVGTNNIKGLTVKVSGSENMTNAEYTGSTVNIIESVGASETTLANMDVNKWGYNLSQTSASPNLEALSYKGIVASGDSYNLRPADYDLTLAFGAKVSTGVASGEYLSEVRVDVAASPESTSSYVDLLNVVDHALMTMRAEDPDFARRFDERQAELKAQYEAKMRGEISEENEDQAEV